METLTGSTRRYSKGFRSVALFTVCIFIFEQIVLASPAPLSFHEDPQAQREVNSESLSEVIPSPETSVSTQDFLSNTLSLSPVESKDEAHPNDSYDADLHSFAYALELIRPEFSAAVPIENLTKENLEKLRHLNVEWAIVVKKGMTFLISGGESNEISVLEEVYEDLQDTDFFAHYQPAKTQAVNPSGIDYSAATEMTEYQLTDTEIVSFNKHGVINSNIGTDTFFEAYQDAHAKSKADEIAARQWANWLVAKMDEVNRIAEDQKLEMKALRAAGTLSYDSTLTSSSLTNFTGSPYVRIAAGSSPQTAISQPNNSSFNLTYNVTQAGSKSSAVVSFDNPSTTAVEVVNLSTATQFIIGVKGPSPKVRIKVTDSLGAVSTDLELINISSSSVRYYKIPKTLLTGVDWTKITGFIYEVDSTLTSTLTGTINFSTKTLTYSTNALTNLPNSPYLEIAAGSSVNTHLIETNTTQFKLNYDITQAGASSGASLILDNPGTTAIETANLSTQTQFVFGLAGPAGGKVKIEFEDAAGLKASVVSGALSTATQYFIFPKENFSGINLASVKKITFSVNGTLITPTTGAITISAKTLSYSANILTNLPASPRLDIMTGSNAGTVMRQTANTSFAFDFVLPDSSAKSGALINFDNPSTTATETQNLSSLNQFVFSAGGVANGKLKITFKDNTGKEASTIISGLAAAAQYYVLSKQLFSSIDLTKVASITFSIDKTQTTLASGTLTIGAKTLLFAAASASVLPASPTALMLESSSAASYLTHPYSTQVRLNYNITGTGSNAGFVYRFDSAADLSQGNTFTLGLQAGNSNLKKTKLEVEDTLGNKTSILVNLTTGNVYHTFQKSQFAGIDWSKIKSLTLFVDPSMTSSSAAYVSWLTVTLNGFKYTPTIAFTSTYTSANVSTLTGTPSLYLMAGSSTGSPLTETLGKFTVNYDISNPATVAGARISFDKVNTTTVETVSLSSFILGASSNSNTIRVEFVDINDKKASLLLTGVQATEKYFNVSLASITGIDKTKIKWIQIYEDQITNANQPKTGTLAISIKGLIAPTLTTPTVDTTFNTSTVKTTQVITGTKTKGTGIAINGVLKVVPDDSTVWRAEVALTPGIQNIVTVQATNGAGVLGPSMQTTITQKTSLSDGTIFTYSGNTLTKEATPDGSQIFYRTDGSVEKYVNGTSEIRYEASGIQIYNSGVLTETVTIPVPSALDTSAVLKMTLESGIEAYYVNGALKEMRTATGIRVTDFALDSSNNIVNAYLVYPDKTVEVIRDGKLIRRIYADGSMMDFLPALSGVEGPSGFAVREITPDHTEYYFYDKVTQTQIQETVVTTTDGGRSRYDEKGILREVKSSTGGVLYYSRTQDSDSYETSLATIYQASLNAKTLLGASYDLNGVLLEMRLNDGTKIIFENGVIKEVRDGQGSLVTDYTFTEELGFAKGLTVNHSSASFQYDGSGFLSTITTDSGTITRTAEDTDGDGDLTDEEITDLLLETVDGNKLSDFELDANGNIVKGLITTQEGIKQRIENGVLTGFETVDGKVYDFANNQAILKEWNFRDGTRIVYGGGTIQEILNPNGSKLHTIGFDSQKNVQSFVEELPDGTKKYFETVNGKSTLKRLVTPTGATIHYGINGLAEKIDLPDSTQETVEYTKDANDNILEITFVGVHTHRSYSPDGVLLNLLTDGMNAEVVEGEVSTLFTRFGTVTTPDFTTNGIMSGTVEFVDGTKQVIQNGVLTQTIRPTGTKINFTNGRISSLQMTNGDMHTIIYSDNANGTLKDAKLRSVSTTGTTEFPLVPYLLGEDNRIPSDPPHQMMVNGDSKIDATSKFGTGSLLLDGSGDTLSTAMDSDFSFGTGDFTVDFWVRFNGLSPQYLLGAQTWDKFSLTKDDHGYLVVMINGRGYDQTGWNPTTGTWYHVAMARKTGQIKTYINGTQIGGIINESGVINLSGNFVIGGRPEGNYTANGRFDEFRVTKGEALWNSNFTKPSAASRKTDNTKLLLHFDGNMNDEELPAIGWDKLPRPNTEIAEILFGRKLQNALAERSDVQSEFETGDTLFFSEIKRDTERGTVYEFGDEWSPEWDGVSLNFSGINQGYIAAANTIGYIGDHPQITADFVDLNGDNLLDRVFMDPTGNFWWLQINDGNKFLAPQKWTGVDKNSHLSQASYPAVSGSLRYMEGGSHTVMGDLLDITGDGLADRVVVDKNNGKWYVQKNNGAGFDAFIEWEGDIHSFSQATGSGQYGIEVRPNCDVTCYKTIQEIAVDLIDLDGDGLLDRVLRPYVAPFTHWFWQKNTGTGFEDALLWEGVDNTFYTGPGAQDSKIAGAISWYLKPGVDSIMADISDLIDMNGDGKVDRVLTKQKDPADPNSALDWYVQLNNGSGFDAAVLWDNSISLATSAGNAAVNSAIRIAKNVDNASGTRHLLSDLRDVTGDGLPDRITVKYSTLFGIKIYKWFVEKNTGSTFAEGETWTSVSSINELEASLGQDLNHFTTYETPNSIRQSVALKDINGDEIQDRLIFRAGEAKWYVQLGTGSGFLPLEELKIEGLETSTESINTTRYDYLHVSLKSELAISSSQGSVKIMLGDPAVAEEYQEWTINNLTTSWQDFYLPIDKTKANASQVKIKFAPAVGNTNSTPIYVENMTFTKFRPDATKDWLDRMLTEENVITEIHSDRTQTLAQYLGLAEGEDSANNFWTSNLETLLKAETRIDFDSTTNDAKEFETFYGSVSKVADGTVTETTLPDGTKIQFSAPSASNPNNFTQTITKSDGTIETNSMSYGRVRTVERPGKSPLEYSYEFDETGAEITVVLDPDTQITERYIKNRLISRTELNGVTTEFIYDGEGNHIRTQIVYMNRVRATYEHAVTTEGYRSVRHEDGVTEEYDADGKIVAHTTPDGFRYVHSYAKARQVVTEYETETAQLSTGQVLEIQVPKVTLVEDPEGEDIHRVTLQSFKDALGNQASYQDGVLASTKDAKGLMISFDKVEEIEKTSDEDASVTYEITPMDVTVFHEDGTITEFRNGQPYSITSATGRVISIQVGERGELINPTESAQFHYQEALKLWQETVLVNWKKYQPSGSQEILGEYTMDGKMLVRQYAEGALELYGSNGRIEEVISREGERLVSYQYDSEGNPTRIVMEGMRRNLEVTVARIRADIMVENQKAFKYVEEREQVISQTVEGQYQVALTRLLAIRAELEAERTNLASILVGGKKGKQAIGLAQIKLDDAFRLVDNAIAQLAQNRIDALNNLGTKVEEARDSINQQTTDAFTRVEIEKNSVLAQIVKQEYLPVVFHWYRKLLGRDPSETEYQSWLDLVNAETGAFDLEALKNELLTGAEYTQRTSEVQGIKNKVSRELNYFLGLSDAQKAQYAALLGIDINLLMAISSAQAESVLAWLNSQSLHFGQSAYASLEGLLEDAGLTRQAASFNPNEAAGNISDTAGTYSRLNIATRLILTDILTGTLTPLEKGDLVLSLYALRTAAAKYGVSLQSYSMSYEALRAMYEAECGTVQLGTTAPVCDFRFVAHINGNHFIIVTGIHLEERTEEVLKVDENGNLVRDENGDPVWEERAVKDEAGNIVVDEVITFIDPGAGPTEAFSIANATQEEFLSVWQTTDAAQPGYGYVLSARGPPASVPQAQYSQLNTQQEMAVRGAFFGWFLKLIAKVIEFVLKIVEKIVRRIGGIVEGIYDAIAEVVKVVFGPTFEAMKRGDIWEAHKELWKAGVKVFKATVRATAEAFRYLFSKEGFAQGLILGIAGAISKYTEVFLTELGVSEKSVATIVAGVDILIGVAAIAFSFGNPTAIAFGISKIAEGAGNLLLLHTDIDPKVVRGIQLGAQIIGAAVGGDPASFSAFLKDAAIIAAQEFASAGVVALGSKIGLDPRISSLIAVPVRAGIGAAGDYLANGPSDIVVGYRDDGSKIFVSSSGGLLDHVKNSVFSSNTLGGVVSIGASIGLEAAGAPSIIQNFVPNILGNIVAGAGNSGGGGGPGPDGIQQQGESFFKKITDGIAKFGQGVIKTASNVISFGAKVIEGIGTLTKEGFSKAVNFFSGIFDRQTTEVLTNNGTTSIEDTLNANCSVLSQGIECAYKTVDINYLLGDEFTPDNFHYKNAGIDATFKGLEQVGNFFGGDIAFANEVGLDGISLNQEFDEQGLRHLSLRDGLDDIFTISGLSEHEPISFANDGSLWSGYLSYEDLDISLKFENGSFAGLDSGLYGNDGVTLSYSDLSDERKSALTEVVDRWFTTSNGIAPEFDSNGLIPYIEEHNSNLAEALNSRQMNSENIRSITMFNSGKLSDGIRVLINSILGIGTSGEMEQKFKEFYEQNNLLPTDEIYPLFYSGSSDAGLQTLVKNNYNAPVVFAVGAFNSFTHIDNDNINTFVNILGQNDSFGRLTDYRNASNIETINVVFQGNVKHSTYWDDNRYDSLIAEMRAEAVKSPHDFKQFLMNSEYYVAEENWNEVLESHITGLEKGSNTANIRETVIVLELPDDQNA